MKQIETLVEDIQNVFQLPHEFSPERLERFSKRLAATVERKVNAEGSGNATLRMSNLGTKCDRKLWYSVNRFHLASELPVSAKIKFLYGDILEDLLLFLAEEAGHTVEGCQDELELNGIKGHRDAIIDGVLVDVKSASSYSFKKFKEGLTESEDAFGYLDQLQSYLRASENDPKIKDPSRAAFLVIDKTLGHICLDIHQRSKKDYFNVVEHKKKLVAQTHLPPRKYMDEPEGKSGNRKLCMECSYCPFNATCWPGLRTFIYSYGPAHLTVVNREPNVPEA